MLFILAECGCTQKLRILTDGTTRVTDNFRYYKNISKFNTEILSEVDTSIVYKEVAFIQDIDSSMFGLNKSKRYRTTYLVNNNKRQYFRFYSNGFVNSFINFDKEEINLRNFNPDSSGFRGVFYRKNSGRITIELFQPVTGYGRYGINRMYLTFSGDSMFVKNDKSTISSTVFVKMKMSEDLSKVKIWSR